MKFDPIIKRDIKVSSRGPGFMALIMVINVILCGAGLLGVFGRLTGMNAYGRIDPGQLLYVYMMVAGIMAVFTILVLPGRTTGIITSERDSGTLDLMIAAGLSPAGIITGKYLSSLLFGIVAVFSCFPALIIPLIYGGVGFSACLLLLMSFLPTAALVLAIGVFASSAARTSSSAAAMAYGIIIALVAGPVLIAFLVNPVIPDGSNYMAYSVLLCPGVPSVSLILDQTGNGEFIDLFFSYLGLVPNAVFMSYITLFSSVTELVMMAAFLIGAGVNITPKRRYR
ncbi:MAG: ABC transporter permease subunit [Lachnospiraceae bacterium]|nr:ABC transporter permease subunit [Lachnospiraceae bacterium]